MEKLIDEAKKGNNRAFHELFENYRTPLESFVYRLTTDREETKDILQDVYIKASQNLEGFKGNTDASIKSWLFTIAANHTKNILNKKSRWQVMAQDQCRDSLVHSPQNQNNLISAINSSPLSQYEFTEHIDFCFTCISKTIPLGQQLTLILKNIYGFKVQEIAQILDVSIPKVKHFLHQARKTLARIYQHRCSLVNKKGVCYQCDELNELFKGKHSSTPLAKKLGNTNKKTTSAAEAIKLRTQLIKAIHPLKAGGTDLHHYLMEHLKKVNDYDQH
ncbi:RNA polymerase sigma factor [Fulvivirgaceae bacterium BMA12]|uniref:RNA polymerase sigma factor n=1 Tax=Agaribacillus aureus TaxID=3051825 RepID=A0ABT8L483_9BACT|nr:RNA polymerase sigma factor [Fulvivirgaceae bacterium BMA12]